jgi:hypothetical protein
MSLPPSLSSMATLVMKVAAASKLDRAYAASAFTEAATSSIKNFVTDNDRSRAI